MLRACYSLAILKSRIAKRMPDNDLAKPERYLCHAKDTYIVLRISTPLYEISTQCFVINKCTMWGISMRCKEYLFSMRDICAESRIYVQYTGYVCIVKNVYAVLGISVQCKVYLCNMRDISAEYELT